MPFVFDFYDEFLVSVTADIDSDSFSIYPSSSGYDYQSFNFDISSGYDGNIDRFDGNQHTVTFTGTDFYGNSAFESFDFTFLEADTDPPQLSFNSFQDGNATYPIYFAGVAEDFESNIDSVQFEVDGQGREYPSIDVDNSTDSRKEFYWDFDYLSEGPHTIVFYVTDTMSNETSSEFNIVVPEADDTAPEFDFSAAPVGNQGGTITYTGSVTDSESEVAVVYYKVDDGDWQWVTIDEDESTDSYKVFSAEISGLSNGNHTIYFMSYDTFSNEVNTSFNVNIDANGPSCSSSFYNLPSPHYSKILNYENITCTDNIGITSAAYEIYHVVQGTLQTYQDHPVLPEDGAFDEASETFDFTVDLTEFGDIDGVVLVNFRAVDAVGNYSTDYDPVTIDATDNTDPVVHIDEVTPDPLTDTSPIITGSCRDETERETNTNISLLEYKIDLGSYQSITLPSAGVYNDSLTESYSVELPELANGAHTVTVRCTDGANHTATTTDTFTVADPLNPEPGEYIYTENFETFDNQDIPASSNIIWGDGKLRLKEDITITRNLISNTDLCPKYATCYGEWKPFADPVDSNIVWYSMSGKVFTYNIQTQAITEFHYDTTYGLPSMGSHIKDFKIGVYNGKKYLWMSDIYSLYVINLTDGVGINASYVDIGSINLDFSRNRFAAYVTTNAPGGSSNVAYINLNDMMNSGDDVMTRIPLSVLGSNDVVGLFTDPSSNAVFLGPYSQAKLFKMNDQNTPENLLDDVLTSYDDGIYNTVFGGMTLDPEGRLIFGTANNSNGRLFVVEDDGGTPFDSSDDNVVQLASPLQLGYRNVYGLEYIQGQNGVGDQLLVNTESNIPIYLNFNNTLTSIIPIRILMMTPSLSLTLKRVSARAVRGRLCRDTTPCML